MLGGLALLAWSLGVEAVDRVVWSPRFAAGLLFLGVVAPAGASWVWYRLLRDGEAIALSVLTLLTPAFSLLLAVLVAGERPGARVLLGMAVVLVGAVAAGWPRSARRSGCKRPSSASSLQSVVNRAGETPSPAAQGGTAVGEFLQSYAFFILIAGLMLLCHLGHGGHGGHGEAGRKDDDAGKDDGGNRH